MRERKDPRFRSSFHLTLEQRIAVSSCAALIESKCNIPIPTAYIIRTALNIGLAQLNQQLLEENHNVKPK